MPRFFIFGNSTGGGGGAGTVTSVNSIAPVAGNVTLAATDVGADAAGAAAAAQAASQPLDGDLTALAGLAATAGLLARTGANAFAVRTLTAGSAKVSVGNGSGAAANPTVDLGAVAIGDLSTIAAATIVGNNTGGASVPLALTAAQTKSTLAIATGDVSGLGTIATQAANNVAISGGSVTGITDLAIADGGTGASTAVAAFNALSPVTTRGDVIVRDATNNVRLALGTSGFVLSSDGTDAVWAGPSVIGLLGDGSDGVINFDGAATVLGLAPSSSIYTLTRDIWLASGSQVSGSAVINTAGFRIFCKGTFTIGASATVHCNGNNASSNTAGAQIGAGTASLGSSIGTAGGAGVVGAGTGTGGTANSVCLGGSGGAGGIISGSGTGGGTAGATATAITAQNSTPRAAAQALTNLAMGSSFPSRYTGGAGGSGGNGAASTTSGGGGGGGGIAFVVALKLVNSGSITANGGNGGNASSSGGAAAGAGGGGGGGGVIVICGPGSTTGTLTANGGTGGTRLGVGANGANGSNGTTFTVTF